MEYDLIAPCYFGTERAAAFDFKNIGARDISVTDGRIALRCIPFVQKHLSDVCPVCGKPAKQRIVWGRAY